MPGAQVYLAFTHSSVAIDLPATVVTSEGSMLRVCLRNLTIEEQEMLTIALFSPADSWLGLGVARQSDNVLRSLGGILPDLPARHVLTFRSIFSDRDSSERKVHFALHRPHIHPSLFWAAALAWAPAAIIETIESPYGIAGIRSIVAHSPQGWRPVRALPWTSSWRCSWPTTSSNFPFAVFPWIGAGPRVFFWGGGGGENFFSFF